MLPKTQPLGQATGSLGWSFIFASVGSISEQSIQRSPSRVQFPRTRVEHRLRKTSLQRHTKRGGKALGLNVASAGLHCA